VSAGLPGLGLGGLFFILSALLAPFLELGRTLRGRGNRAAWRPIGRQFAQAVTMILAVDLALRMIYAMLGATGLGDPPPLDSATVLPLLPIGITAGLLAGLLSAAKAAHVVQQSRQAGLPALPVTQPRPDPLRALAVGGTAAAAFFGLLVFGASDLSPLSERSGAGRSPTPVLGATPPAGRAEAAAAEPSPPVAVVKAAARLGADDRAVVAPPNGGRPEDANQPPVAESKAGLDSAAPSVGPGKGAENPGVGGGNGGNAGAGPPAGAGPGTAPGGSATTPGGGGQQTAGPPENAGPKEGSKAPETAGPPLHAGPKEPLAGGHGNLADPLDRGTMSSPPRGGAVR
jgi:hypothetical protein